jgi:hypothetical protein
MEGTHAAHAPIFVNWFLAVALAGVAVGCGDDSSSASPSAPSPSSSTATSVNVTVTSPIRMGQTAQASAVAALSNGQSQNVTSGWRSDAVGVATVTDAGLVTGVANGQATIYVIAGGRQGQQVIRVVPDYHGEWEGTLRVTSCAQTGIFADLGLCNDVPANASEEFDLALTQTGEAMSVRMYLGDGYQTVAAPIAPDGSAAFAGRASYTEEGITLTLDSAWQINSTRVGALSGTVNDVYRLAGYPGEGRVSYDIQLTTRTAAAVRALKARGGRAHVVQGLGQRLRSMR